MECYGLVFQKEPFKFYALIKRGKIKDIHEIEPLVASFNEKLVQSGLFRLKEHYKPIFKIGLGIDDDGSVSCPPARLFCSLREYSDAFPWIIRLDFIKNYNDDWLLFGNI